jgi:hypothetical protein
MSKSNSLTKDDLTRFVRGEKPWSMLLSRGVEIEFEDKKIKAKSKGEPVIVPIPEDIAAGFARLRGDAVALREWASVMLALGELDLDKLEENAEGEVLKEALWDASFDEAVSSRAWSLVDRLVLKS